MLAQVTSGRLKCPAGQLACETDVKRFHAACADAGFDTETVSDGPSHSSGELAGREQGAIRVLRQGVTLRSMVEGNIQSASAIRVRQTVVNRSFTAGNGVPIP